MQKTESYLREFKPQAANWFAKETCVREYFEFFRDFFVRENLEKAEWSDIQEIGARLHCFNSVALAKANALGRPNHPIEHYRKSFIYLAHGPGEASDRIRHFCKDEEYRLAYFGDSAVSELVGYLFPDQFIFANARDHFAVKYLEIEVEKPAVKDLVGRLEALSKAIKPAAIQYQKIVGNQTDLPLNLELDQFFNWLYERYSGGKHTSPGGAIAYWWLNANPKIWDFTGVSVGDRETYSSHNEKGNKRQKYKYFQEAKAGDIVVGYVTAPQKEIVAVCKITKGLHQTENGQEIEFEKTEQLDEPIPYEKLQDIPDLAASEPLISHQGSLFRLTEPEYEIIRNLIDETDTSPHGEIEIYDKAKAMQGLFLSQDQFDEMLEALNEKRNLVLQGAPGVGKTFVAKRLAYALIGSNDPQRMQVIQFHQSYSYEDFIQGFRPTPKGHFDLRYGIFYQFCRRAQREERQNKPFVFVIDEINRGNLSKIFGELMMLIEADKRGREHAIPLAYSQDTDERFYIPANLYFIGMMNTADRSLAMVDYALRRRFRFITLRPEFSSEGFQDVLVNAGAEPRLVKRIVDRMNALNDVISADSKSLGPGYQIGHSYFCPPKAVKPDAKWYRRVVDAEIVPLIEEYWFDNESKVKEQRSALLFGVES
jgi:MoxR-like ATPase